MFGKFDLNTIIRNKTSLSLSQSYNHYDNVESITVTENNKGYHIEGVVNVLSKRFTCTIDVDKKGNVLSYRCPCIWSNQYSPCGHIGAILLKLNQFSIQSVPFYYQNDKMGKLKEISKKREQELLQKELRKKTSTSRDFIRRNKTIYQSQIAAVIQQEKYELEPTLSYDNREKIYCLDYKVGNEKKYVIKNLTTFLHDIENKKEVTYGKFLSFSHSPEAFSNLALKQIEFIKEGKKQFENNVNEYYYSYYHPTLHRYVSLTPSLLDRFYDTYQNQSFPTFQLEEREMLVPISMKEDDNTYTLHLDLKQHFYLGEKHLYFFQKRKDYYRIQRVSLDDQGITVDLLEELKTKDIIIMKEDYQDFYKYVLSPILSHLDLSSSIEIEENPYQDIYIYGDLEQEEIQFKVFYSDENQNRVPGFNQDIVTNYKQDIVENYIKQYAREISDTNHIAYFDIDNEKTYEFVNEGINFLNQYANVYVSESLKKIGKTANYNISVGVRIEHDLLALDLDSVQIPKDEIAGVLSQYKRKKKFYRLKNGELLYLESPQLEELNQLMERYHLDSRDMEDGMIRLNSNRMFAIDQEENHLQYIRLNRSDMFQERVNQFYHNEKQEYIVPSHYQNILRDYQKEGYIWIKTLYDYGFNGILADDMGLGKTLQVIAVLDSFSTALPSIVIAPASLIYNWEDEVHKFSDTLSTLCIVGNKQERSQKIKDANNYQLLITSYDYLRRDYELYEDKEFEYVILDEAQYIKNQKTKNAITVKKIKGKHKLALTGTPIENSLSELWSIFDFLMPQYLFNYHYFQSQYENDIVKRNDANKISELRKLVSPFVLRRNKQDVLTELPDKIEKVQSIPFEEEESKLYFANLAQVNNELQEILQMDRVDKIAILAMLTRLRQICCEPRLLYENIDHISSKMKACIDLITNFKENHQRVLLFSSFTTVLDLLAKELNTRGISFSMLTGKTSKEDRHNLVTDFQNGKTDVFLISLKAGGTGLNLTAAQAVIHFDPWWNLSAQNQATDRAYRIGQEKNVQVFSLVMKDSIEEKIVALQQKKKELADMFVENNDGGIASMSKEDIMALFTD